MPQLNDLSEILSYNPDIIVVGAGNGRTDFRSCDCGGLSAAFAAACGASERIPTGSPESGSTAGER